MCFSSEASFVAGTVLTVIGIASMKNVQRPSQIPFACIPVIFAFQQVIEGFLWIFLINPYYIMLERIFTYLFLFIAQIVWPVWVPFSILLLETKTKRKVVEKTLVALGILVSAYLGYCLSVYTVKANILGHHISYDQFYPASLALSVGVLYVIVTVAPLFISGIKRMWILGICILLSYIITEVFYEEYIVSVWCFFAAAISITAFIVLYQLKKNTVL